MSYESLLKELGADKSTTKHSSSTEQYIILHNHALTKEIQEVKKSLFEKNAEYEELDEELDSITRSRNTLQSYLKNQQEILELHTMCKKEVEFGYKRNMSILGFMNAFFTATITYMLTYFDNIMAAVCFSLIACVLITGIVIIYEVDRTNVSNTETKNRLKALKATNETVSTLIDNM